VVVCVGEIASVPLKAFVPDHPPLAVQEVALTELHCKTLVELIPKVTIGDGIGVGAGVGAGVVLVTREASLTQPSTPESKSTYHQVIPPEVTGPWVTVPVAPELCVPRTVLVVLAAEYTVTDPVVCTLPPIVNLGVTAGTFRTTLSLMGVEESDKSVLITKQFRL
jgi:hypothetical protein